MNKLQRNSENIECEIKTIWIIVYWKQWAWKTLFAINLALDWEKRIYANFSIFKNWKIINKPLVSVSDVNKIRFSYTPWVIVIDEAWINANSKDSRSEQSRILQEILFLVRKKNCSLIWISQRFESIDINARVLSELIIEMRKISRWKSPPIFIATRQKQKGSKLIYMNQFKIDTIWMMKKQWITYNTLETSKFESIKKDKKEKDQDNEESEAYSFW